mgnify:CR=1 FL=1
MVQNLPVRKFRIGNIDSAIWENKKSINGGEVVYRTVTLSRSYKKKDEEIWRSEVINNIRRNDISKIMAILRKVEDYLYFEAGKENEEESGDDE